MHGLAKAGMKPIVPIYSSFLQRGYDQVLHDICIPNLPVTICVDRAGIVGNDGETHQGIFDLSFLNTIPNLTIMAPKNFAELEDMLEIAINANTPVAIRYPRGGENSSISGNNNKVEIGKAEVLKEGNSIAIFAIGKMVATAMEVSDSLNDDIAVINVRTLKPIDVDTIVRYGTKANHIITIEDNITVGGLGETVQTVLREAGISTPLTCYGYPREFVKQASVSEIEEIYGLNAWHIVSDLKKIKNL